MLKILRPGRSRILPEGAIRSVAPPTTTSSLPTCWPRATTPPDSRARGDRRNPDNRSINGIVRQRPARRRGYAARRRRGHHRQRRPGLRRRHTGPALETEAATRTGDSRCGDRPGPSRATRRCSTTSRSTPGTPDRGDRPSGAGKSTFARQVAGPTHPTSGTVTFEGHDIHAEYARCVPGSAWCRRTTSCTGS